MLDASTLLLTFLREAWMALAGALLGFALLAGISQLLRAGSASVMRASHWVWSSASTLLSILVLGLFAFLGIPSLVSALQTSLPGTGGCGPITELGTLASGLIGGLAALRMLKAAFASMLSASLGGSSSLANALLESGETLFGMILASMAIPLTAWFLGTC